MEATTVFCSLFASDLSVSSNDRALLLSRPEVGSY